MNTRVFTLVMLGIGGACGGGGGDSPPSGTDAADGTDPDGAPGAADAGPGEVIDPADEGCAALFRQEEFPEYQIEIAQNELDAMNQEFLDHQGAGQDSAPYHPIVFRHGDEVADAMIRLKGSTSWLATTQLDPNPKMQFVISFNEVDPEGRYAGLRKIELDMPRTDDTFLRQRLALYYLRSTGIEAQCANNARLVINGEYYGLFTNLERPDKEFIQRVFPGSDDGDLWKGGRIIKTNETTFTWDRLGDFWDVSTVSQLDALADLDGAVREWASEAMIPDGDGYYMGRPNFYLYDHPIRGFLWIAHDLDSGFDFLQPTISPLFAECPPGSPGKCAGRTENDRQHYAIVLNDEGWRARYVEELVAARASYDPDVLATRVAEWSAQVNASAEEDPHRPFTMEVLGAATDVLSGYPALRAAAVDAWLDCEANGGSDGDGDGFDWCDDCDDASTSRKPGATETCNGRDDDCDFQVDDVAGGC